jgi:transposase
VKLSWAEPSSRFTALFEGLAIEWLKHASQSAVARQLKLSWDEIHHIVERAVARGLQRRKAEPLPMLGVDEKAFRRGHHYFTLVNDLAARRVLSVAEHRTQASLDGFWATLTTEQRQSIEAVAMDMWSLTSSRSVRIWTKQTTKSFSTNSTSPNIGRGGGQSTAPRE